MYLFSFFLKGMSVYFLLAVLIPVCQLSLAAASMVHPLDGVCRLLIAVASLVVEHRL